jgi:hypothetical protein
MAKQRATIEDEIGEAISAVKAAPRLPKHDPEEFEVQRHPIEYAPPTVRDDFAIAAAGDPLPPERAKIVEQGLVALQQSHAERDRMRRDIGSLRQRITELETILKAKESEEHIIEKRCRECLEQRDNAVTHAAQLDGVLSSLAAILVGYFRPENHKRDVEKDQPESLSQT